VKLRIGSVWVYYVQRDNWTELWSLSANHWMIVSSTSSPNGYILLLLVLLLLQGLVILAWPPHPKFFYN
jgi:hypothetical protein